MEKKEIGQNPFGVLVVNKPAGMTSHDVVGKIRRLYGTRQVGHTGTLDPMATGVLILLLGRATKACEYLSIHKKSYLATLRLGITTDTEDTSGKVLTQSDFLPTFDEIERILPEFRGTSLQIPPMYSAIKVNGQKLVDLARKGETVEREARQIEIFNLELHPTNSPADYKMNVTCSGGTYIRTLCADIGKRLGCGGAMAELQRTDVGGLTLKDAHTFEELEDLSPEERLSLLLPLESLFEDIPKLALPAFFERLIRSGCTVLTSKLGNFDPVGTKLRLCSENGHFFALGEVTPDGVRSMKLFEL